MVCMHGLPCASYIWQSRYAQYKSVDFNFPAIKRQWKCCKLWSIIPWTNFFYHCDAYMLQLKKNSPLVHCMCMLLITLLFHVWWRPSWLDVWCVNIVCVWVCAFVHAIICVCSGGLSSPSFHIATHLQHIKVMIIKVFWQKLSMLWHINKNHTQPHSQTTREKTEQYPVCRSLWCQ